MDALKIGFRLFEAIAFTRKTKYFLRANVYRVVYDCSLESPARIAPTDSSVKLRGAQGSSLIWGVEGASAAGCLFPAQSIPEPERIRAYSLF